LDFYDAAGKPRAGLGLSNNGTSLRFLGNDGKVLSGLTVENGGVAIAYVDENGRGHPSNDALKNDTGFALSDERPAVPRTAVRP
jgi:hypothetical protein